MYLLKYPLVILYLLTVIGCSDAAMQTESVKPLPTSNEQTSEFTKDDAIAIFKKDNDMNHYEITDLILVKDEQFPKLKAVISFYDKKENNVSNLAFIYENVSYNICFAVNEVDGIRTFDIAEGSQLTYVENGAVSTSIRKKDTSEIIDYKISISHDESTSTTHFEVISEEPREINS